VEGHGTLWQCCGRAEGRTSPQAFAALIRSETKKWGDIIVRPNIKLE
jgi:hypothetical protein